MATDICFVGAGIACLYAAHQLLKMHPGIRIIILEKGNRAGGRAHNVEFHNTQIPEGAGIGRYRKDRLLRALMEELDIPVYTWRSKHSATFETENVMHVIQRLKQAVSSYDRNKVTFSQFARKELGTQRYKKFVESTGYSDFHNADIIDTLYHYGFDDTQGIKSFSVPWNTIMEHLVEKVGRHNIIFETTVEKIEPHTSNNAKPMYLIHHTKGVVSCRNVIVGTTVSALQCLFKTFPIYKGIHSQPFLRVYAKISPHALFEEKIKTYTLVKGHIQKVIPIDPKNHVYMIAYADNEHAIALASISHDKIAMAKALSKATSVPGIKLEDLHVNYWQEGTHYFAPLPKEYKTRNTFVKHAQRPMKNVWVIGEAVSLRHHGWTQGALESVHAILHDVDV